MLLSIKQSQMGKASLTSGNKYINISPVAGCRVLEAETSFLFHYVYFLALLIHNAGPHAYLDLHTHPDQHTHSLTNTPTPTQTHMAGGGMFTSLHKEDLLRSAWEANRCRIDIWPLEASWGELHKSQGFVLAQYIKRFAFKLSNKCMICSRWRPPSDVTVTSIYILCILSYGRNAMR